jgi:enhancing lycopene biosynthesis protein 2
VNMKKIAVILSGCGVYDGSEIHEATAALLALDRAGADVTICAPTGDLMHVINHQTGEPAEGESRNIQVESARIAAGRTIGAMCIAPAVIARVFGADLKPTVTIGTDPATAAAINATGAVHQDTPVDGVVIDGKNRIVSTPAYMMAGCISEVFDGASKFIAAVLETC